MAKLPTLKNTCIPDVEFLNEIGVMTKNTELSDNLRVLAEITFADIDEKNDYMQFYSEAGSDKDASVKMFQNYDYKKALEKHVTGLRNLFDDKNNPIKTGRQLIACKHPFLNDLKQDLFFRICGVRVDGEDTGAGELNEGEKLASD